MHGVVEPTAGLVGCLMVWIEHRNGPPLCLVIDSLNHRMAWLGRDLKDHEAPTSLLQAGPPTSTLHTAQWWPWAAPRQLCSTDINFHSRLIPATFGSKAVLTLNEAFLAFLL